VTTWDLANGRFARRGKGGVGSDGNSGFLGVLRFGELGKLRCFCSSFPPFCSVDFKYVIVLFFLSNAVRVQYFNDMGLPDGEAI